MTGNPKPLRLAIGLACAAGAGLLAGCTSVTEILNPEFLSVLGAGETVADLPGEAPAVLIEVENRAGRPIEFLLSWRDGDGAVTRLTGRLPPDGNDGQVLFCPLEELTLGDVGDLDATGAIVRLGDGGANDPFIEVEPFGVLLQQGINYDCGDSVMFTVLPSGATPSGYQIFAFIRRSGAQAQTQTP